MDAPLQCSASLLRLHLELGCGCFEIGVAPGRELVIVVVRTFLAGLLKQPLSSHFDSHTFRVQDLWRWSRVVSSLAQLGESHRRDACGTNSVSSCPEIHLEGFRAKASLPCSLFMILFVQFAEQGSDTAIRLVCHGSIHKAKGAKARLITILAGCFVGIPKRTPTIYRL